MKKFQIPFVNSVIVGCVILAELTDGKSAQILYGKGVSSRYSLKMDGVVEVIGSESPWCESGHGFIEESSIRGGEGHVGGKVYGGCVDVGIGRDIGYGGEEIVHHARVVGVVDGRLVVPRLEYIAPVEAPCQGHVVQVHQNRPVGENRIDVDLLDVRQVGHAVHRQVEIVQVLYLAIIHVHLLHLVAYLVEGVAGQPVGRHLVPEGLVVVLLVVLVRDYAQKVASEQRRRRRRNEPPPIHPPRCFPIPFPFPLPLHLLALPNGLAPTNETHSQTGCIIRGFPGSSRRCPADPKPGHLGRTCRMIQATAQRTANPRAAVSGIGARQTYTYDDREA
jgi:hypothetical protein